MTRKKGTIIPLSITFKVFALGILALEEKIVLREMECVLASLEIDLMMMETVLVSHKLI